MVKYFLTFNLKLMYLASTFPTIYPTVHKINMCMQEFLNCYWTIIVTLNKQILSSFVLFFKRLFHLRYVDARLYHKASTTAFHYILLTRSPLSNPCRKDLAKYSSLCSLCPAAFLPHNLENVAYFSSVIQIGGWKRTNWSVYPVKLVT